MAISDTMKPALKTLVEAEFQRVGYDPNAASKASRAPKGDGQLSAGGVIPRVDLNSVLERNILDELTTTEGKNSWQVSVSFSTPLTHDSFRIVKQLLRQLFKFVNEVVILLKQMLPHVILLKH